MSSNPELAAFALRMVVERIRFRIDAMEERQLSGVSISRGFATEIVHACEVAAKLLKNPEPEQSGLTVGSGLDSANVSEDVTGDGEHVVEDAVGEIRGHAVPKVDDPAASTPRCL